MGSSDKFDETKIIILTTIMLSDDYQNYFMGGNCGTESYFKAVIWHPIQTLVSVQAVPLPMQLPANLPGKPAEDDARTEVTDHLHEKPK